MWTKRLIVVLVLAGLAVFGWAAGRVDAAPAGPGFNISWYTMDGGGGTSNGTTFSVSGTVGQADAGSHSGSTFQITGGFWTAWLKVHGVKLPVIIKN